MREYFRHGRFFVVDHAGWWSVFRDDDPHPVFIDQFFMSAAAVREAIKLSKNERLLQRKWKWPVAGT